MPRCLDASAHRRHGKTTMGYGEFTRAAARRSASAAARRRSHDASPLPSPHRATCTYDALHRRVLKKGIAIDGWDDYYYNSAWQVLEVRRDTTQGQQAPVLRHQYVWSVRYIDAPVLRDENKDADGDCTDGDDERLYFCNDVNMNVVALVNDSNEVVERYLYDPYGRTSVLHGVKDAAGTDTSASEWNFRGPNKFDNELGFCGYWHDFRNGFYHVRHRAYYPNRGWLQRDPLGYVDGMSLYEYCAGRPIAGVDPDGLDRLVVSGGVQDNPKDTNHDWNWRNFVTAGALQLGEQKQLLREGERLEWLVYRPAYITRAMADCRAPDAYTKEIERIAKSQGAILRWFGTTREFIACLNYGADGAPRGFRSEPMAVRTSKPKPDEHGPLGLHLHWARVSDAQGKTRWVGSLWRPSEASLIRSLHIYSHGIPGALWFDYGTTFCHKFGISDVERVAPGILAIGAKCESWACRTANPVVAFGRLDTLSGLTSLSYEWQKQTGAFLEGAVGGTDYHPTATGWRDWNPDPPVLDAGAYWVSERYPIELAEGAYAGY